MPTNVIGVVKGYQSTSAVINQIVWDSASNVYTVPNTTGGTLTMGFLSGTSGANQNNLESVL